MNWVDVVGYQHEVVHTGVLRHLLKDTTTGPALLKGLGVAGVTSISNPVQEQRLGGRTRGPGKADLTATIEIDGRQVSLAVETKVDSHARREQLEATVADGEIGVLLAVGVSALQFDLDQTIDRGAWHLVGPEDWLAALREVQVEPELRAYVDAVRAESERHAAARELACTGPERLDTADDDLTRGSVPGSELLQWAWLSEMRKALGSGVQADGDPLSAPWWGGKQISGPFMWSAFGGWKQSDDVDVYLNLFVENGFPRLGVRVGGGPSEAMRRTVAEVGEFVAMLPGFERPKRRGSAQHGTTSVASFPLGGLAIGESAAAVREAVGRIDAEVGRSADRSES